MLAPPSKLGKARRAATIITNSGLIPPIRSTWSSAAIKAPSSLATAAPLGVLGTTSPPAQFYHVITDNQFPYWVYGAQQDSGAAAVPSRGKFRNIDAHDWRPVEAGDENGYIAVDPLNPGMIFGGPVVQGGRLYVATCNLQGANAGKETVVVCVGDK